MDTSAESKFQEMSQCQSPPNGDMAHVVHDHGASLHMTRMFAADPSCRYDGGHSELFRRRLGTVGFTSFKCTLFGPDLGSFRRFAF